MTEAQRKAVNDLINAADALISAIDGTTDQFEGEVSDLSTATSALEKAIEQ